MKLVLELTQIIISILLVTMILLQQRGGGLSPVLGGEGGFYRTRRGIEKLIFYATIILGALFLTMAFLNLFLR